MPAGTALFTVPGSAIFDDDDDNSTETTVFIAGVNAFDELFVTILDGDSVDDVCDSDDDGDDDVGTVDED